MPRPLQHTPTQHLRNALVERDITDVRCSLENGALAEGDTVSIGNAPYPVKTPLEFVIRKHYPKEFLDALLNAGATTEEERRNGRMSRRSLLAVAIEVGNSVAVNAILARRPPHEVAPWEWRACIESRKPHLWVERLLDHECIPDRGNAAAILGKMVAYGQKRTIDILLARVDLPDHWAAWEDVVAGGIRNAPTFRYLLTQGLKANPRMLEELHAAGLGVFPVAIEKAHEKSDQGLRGLMSIPELSFEIEMKWKGKSVVQLFLDNQNTRKRYPTALAAGARFEEILPQEEKEDYLSRLAPAMMENIRNNTPPGFVPEWNIWLDNLWAQAQRQQMALNTPVASHKPARRF